MCLLSWLVSQYISSRSSCIIIFNIKENHKMLLNLQSFFFSLNSKCRSFFMAILMFLISFSLPFHLFKNRSSHQCQISRTSCSNTLSVCCQEAESLPAIYGLMHGFMSPILTSSILVTHHFSAVDLLGSLNWAPPFAPPASSKNLLAQACWQYCRK